ncbi:MAG: hypothetical protein Q8873_04570 [Bacillota bacterium]|nr:hypothetical protein [Bacillota bacterium]
MKKFTIIIIAVLMITFSGCSQATDNNPQFSVKSSTAEIWEGDAGEYGITLFFEVANTSKYPLYLKPSDFDIFDKNNNLIDVIERVNAYPPIIKPGEIAVYSESKTSKKTLDASMGLKVMPKIKPERSNIKLTTLTTPGGGMDVVIVENHTYKEYENVQVAVVCRNRNNKITGVLKTKIDSIKPGESVEAETKGRLITKDLDPDGGGKTQFFAYIEPRANAGNYERKTMHDIIALVPFLLILLGAICLQIFLSKKRKMWLGLILPLTNFIVSLIPAILVFQDMPTPNHYEKYDEYGKLIESATVEPARGMSHFIFMIIMAFLIYNISTLVFMAIYWVCRKRKLKTHYEAEEK